VIIWLLIPIIVVIYGYMMGLYIDITYLVGGLNPSEKYESKLGG